MKKGKFFLGTDNIAIPLSLQKIASNTCLKYKGFRQFGEDIFITRGDVKKHKDPTEDGKVTVVCILYEEGGYSLRCEQPLLDDYPYRISLPTGTIVRFDARYLHELGFIHTVINKFAAIIWDVPMDKSMEDIKREFLERIDELVRCGIPGKKENLIHDTDYFEHLKKSKCNHI